MNAQLSTFLTVLSILGIIGGFIGWILGRILTDKKDKLTLTFEIERLKEMFKDMKIDNKKIEEEIDLIKNKIAHL